MNQLNLLNDQDYAYSKISSSAMLVDLSISVWTGRKLDKAVSAEIDQAKSTTTKAGNYHKNLLAGSEKLAEIGKIAGAIRNWHYTQSTPWSDAGTRLLPATLFVDYKARLTQYEKMFSDAVDGFLLDYDTLVSKSAFSLGGLFNRDDYPLKEKVAEKFAFNYYFSPVPESGDFRVDIGEAGMAELKDRYNNAFKDRIETSMKDVWDKTYTTLKHISEKLDETKGKQRLFDSMVDNAHELTDLLRHLNITGDLKLEALRKEMESQLKGITTDDLREDEGLRLETKEAVDKMLAKFAF